MREAGADEQIDRLFARALELDAAARATLLDEAAREAPEVAHEVRSLLEHLARAGEFLETPIVDPRAVPRRLPERVGPYEVLDVLGEGGMGIVYLARQPHPRRTVALKVLLPGLVTAARARRFAQEAELAGRLEHEHIARVYDAGFADTGASLQPYFAMEVVDGRPIDVHAEAAGLGARERLALLADLADAVQHAHERGVVHRDLKPGNVLVVDNGVDGGIGNVKVLDFGVARALDLDREAVTLATRTGQLLGTLPYMSPEQAAGAPHAVDARSDVYALGVIAYELLAGRLPYDVDGKPLSEAARIVREEEPTRLGALRRELAGDVETIVGTALAKDPDRRYPSAGAFAEDVRLFLSDRPIRARRPSRVDQLRKLARRHRALFAGVAAVIFVLALSLAAALWQNELLAAQRDRVVAQTARALRVTGWLEGLLSSVDPSLGGRDVRLLDVLERADEQLPPEVLEDAEIEARVRTVIGRTYLNLGEPGRALPHLEAALVRAAVAHGPDQAATLEARALLGRALLALDRVEEAEPHVVAAAEGLPRVVGELDERALSASDYLAMLLARQGRGEEAEARTRETIAGWRAAGPGQARSARRTRANLAVLLTQAGRLDEALAELRGVVEEWEAAGQTDLPDGLQARNNLANALAEGGRLEEAETILRGVLAQAPRVLGDRHLDTLSVRNNLGKVLGDLEHLEEAEDLLRSAYEARRETLGAEHVATLTSANNLSVVLGRAGRSDEAEAVQRETIDTLTRAFGPAEPRTLATRANLAFGLLRRGDADGACAIMREVVELSAGADPDGWRTAAMRVTYGDTLLALGRDRDALVELERGHAVLAASLGADHPRSAAASRSLEAVRARLER